MIEDMKDQGVIRLSHSPWASPVVLVPKKDGHLCFCVDYRHLNRITKKDVYPLPRIDDILDATYYLSSLDLASGYCQVELDSESQNKSAFTTYHVWECPKKLRPPRTGSSTRHDPTAPA